MFLNIKFKKKNAHFSLFCETKNRQNPSQGFAGYWKIKKSYKK
jgi:hypothetical protein